ncbi:DUF4129 domain-containing protein [Elizabethkingia anophelis]|uniref:DUF4129 domain-containing protein n=1 Tax=Elizabethkingia anophelis TaxID=1117645 RepID=UPI00099570E4|nr:DUF4129 domain-containing protein [Elizabethkingia anophelis]AQW94259.1 DUF4129 domain-containing protein [Elizabethkingia anophelis]EJC8059211.1 DUF4129 domain-containing protein [Elizabethkingia anophelis]MCT3699707.1 DUF4129 domain-containing protein [Elizabethkingia anophelis]MCT3757354.1 DUF4129 domain-containing protein [Elizabethkingia anophelis]MCT3832826.1 DUF4129 domain-containing protein [Elizabethkingia anophelis]
MLLFLKSTLLVLVNNRILYIIFLFTLSVHAQEVDSIVSDEVIEKNIKDKNQLKTDSLLKKGYATENVVYPGTFDAKFKEKYQGSDFDYSVNKPKESLWQKFKKWLGELLNDWFQSNSLRGANDLFYVLLRIIAIVLIGFVLYVIIRFVLSRNGNWVFSKKSKKLNPEDRTITENIHELDLPSLIKNYEDKKEYRSAVRYQFLYLLKLMTDKNMLEWDPEKTNRDYIRMLSGNALQSDFQKLSFVFENVWYGERTIGENEYTIFRKQYQQTQQKI